MQGDRPRLAPASPLLNRRQGAAVSVVADADVGGAPQTLVGTG